MAYEIVIPRLGLTMETGRIIEWYKQDGESVTIGEPLFAVETDKAALDVPAEANGIVYRNPNLGCDPLPIGTVVGRILTPGEELHPHTPTGKPTEDMAPMSPTTVADASQPKSFPKGQRLSSPAARRRAKELGIDLSSLEGPKDTPITAAQVEQVSRTQAPHPAAAPAGLHPIDEETEVIPLTQIRSVISRRMVECAHTVVPATLTTEADATELVAWREKLRLALSAKGVLVPTFTALFVKLTAAALQQHPLLNARLTEKEIILQKNIHIAVAVDTEAGLLVPVIRNVQAKSIQQIAEELYSLARRARARKLEPDNLQGGTFTVSNLGAFGIDAFTPIINLPQCAILGFGRIIAKPVVLNEQILPRKVVTLNLTHDHRLVDGAPAARFLNTIRGFVEQPSLWTVN